MTARARRIDWVLFDVNETLTDLAPAEQWMSAHGFADGALGAWLAAVLRDGFAASLVGRPASFAALGGSALRERAGAADLETRTLSVDETAAWKPHPGAYAAALGEPDLVVQSLDELAERLLRGPAEP